MTIIMSPSETDAAISPARQGGRVLLVTNIPTPYRIPLFNELHAQLSALGISFKVVFAALGYPRRKWEIDMTQCTFPWEVLQSGRFSSHDPESALFTYSGLGRILAAEPDTLVIVGGFSPATSRLWLRSLFSRTTYLIWSGAIPREGHPDSWFRRWQRRRLVARASGFIAYGTLARDYLISLGAPPAAVSIGINTVDSDFFRGTSTRVHRELAQPSHLTKLIHVGELSTRKRVDLLFRAVALLSQTRQDFVLQLIGSGPEEERLRALSVKLGIFGKVEFMGFKQKPEIADYLARADCFLFPTGFDIWGLVMVEAMAAGLVCLASVHAGATVDLIKDGETGFAVDFDDSASVAQRLLWVLDHPAESREVGRKAQQFVEEHVSVRASAGGFVRAICGALTNSQHKVR